MAAFPSTVPLDTDEVGTYIRWWLGGLDEDTLDESTLTDLIQLNIDAYGDLPCKVTYYSTVSVLRWLIRKTSTELASVGAGGEVTRRKEIRGKTTIEVEYSESTSSESDWESILNDLMDDPDTIGCNVYDDDKDSIGNLVVGGADVNGYTASFRSKHSFERAIRRERYRNRAFGSYRRGLF